MGGFDMSIGNQCWSEVYGRNSTNRMLIPYVIIGCE